MKADPVFELRTHATEAWYFKNWKRCSSAIGDLRILELLLGNPKYFTPCCEENRPLRMASFLGHSDVVELLLQMPSVDPSAWNNQAIIDAAESNFLPVVKSLLQDPRVDPSAQCNSAITSAAGNGNFRVVEYLLSDPRVDPSAGENSALNCAVLHFSISTISLLLADSRVDPSLLQDWALLQVLKYKRFDILELLLSDSRIDPSLGNNSAIISAVMAGCVELTERLLGDSRVDPTCRVNLPLRLAAKHGHMEIVKLLLADARVDPFPVIQGPFWFERHTLCDIAINAPFHEAIENGHNEMAILFLDHPQVDLGARWIFSTPTYLELAMSKGSLPIVQRLLDDPRMDLETVNPLFYAASQGLAGVVELLLKHPRFSPGWLHKWRSNSIDAASSKDHVEIVKILMLDPRFNPMTRPVFEMTLRKKDSQILEYLVSDSRLDCTNDVDILLKIACEFGHVELLTCLLSSPDTLDITADDSEAVRVAFERGHSSILEHLLEYVLERDVAKQAYIIVLMAIRRRLTKVVCALLDDPRIDPGFDSNCVMLLACRSGCLDLARYFMEHHRIDKVSLLDCIRLVDGAEADVARLLLSDETLCISMNENYLVRFMSSHGEYGLLVELLRRGADPSALDNEAFRLAAENGHVAVVKLLLEDERVDPSACGNFAVKWAKRNRHLNIVDIMSRDERCIL
ncbi:ankyrin repeat-containing domain protein [Obelidium mucronatum]|nr:ankyrin repeat-containing domain protein [Obelidium mucronatum]